jgi:hypothetical protein
VWRVVHVMLSQEGCVRCGGDLEAIGDRQDLLELHHRERRFAPQLPTVEPSSAPIQQSASS